MLPRHIHFKIPCHVTIRQGEVQTAALNHTVAMSPSNIQWCMDVPIKNASYLHSLDTFLLQKGLIVCLQLFGKSNEAEKGLDHL